MAKSTINSVADRIISELTIARGRGRTCQEIVNRYELNRGTVSTRLSEMVNNGTIVTNTTRNNTRGYPVAVYTLPHYA
jgi:DNA-binding IclR family transcriptional regulator